MTTAIIHQSAIGKLNTRWKSPGALHPANYWLLFFKLFKVPSTEKLKLYLLSNLAGQAQGIQRAMQQYQHTFTQAELAGSLKKQPKPLLQNANNR